jgi:hypothetical protein
MALNRKIKDQLIKIGLSEEQIKAEIEPLENKGELMLEKIFSIAKESKFKDLRGQLNKSLQEDITQMEASNSALEKKLIEQENIYKKHAERIQEQVSGLNKEYSRIFGDAAAKKITENITKSFKDSEATLVESLKTLEEPFSKSISEIEQKINIATKKLEDTIKNGKRRQKRRQELTEEIAAHKAALLEQQRLLNDQEEKNKNIVDKHRQYGIEINKTNISLQEQEEKLAQARKLYHAIVEENKELNELAKETTDHFGSMLKSINPNASESSRTIFSSIAAQMMILNNTGDKFVDKMSSLGSILGKQFGSVFGDLKKNITGFFDYVYNQSVGKAIEFNVQYAELNKTTGGFGQRGQAAILESTTLGMGNLATTNNLTRFGIGVKDLNKSFADLSNNMRGFNNLNQSTQQSLTVAAAKMENLGVASSQTAKLFETFTSTFNKTGAGAEEMLERLSKDALGLNISVNKYLQDFESILSKISGYATSAEEVFKKMNAIANVTKISINQLAGFGDSFKTLEGATKLVAGLGAALGGTSLRATELVALDPADAIIRIKEELEASGMSFDKLNIGMKRFIAESMGFSDINEAAKLFTGSLSQMRAEMDKSAASQDELKKRQEESVAFQEQYKKLLENLTILVTPIIKVINALSTALMWLSEVPVVGFLLPLIGMFGALAWAIRGTFGIGARFVSLMQGSAAAFTTMNTGVAAGDAAYLTLTATLGAVTTASQLATASLLETAAAAATAKVATGAGALGGIGQLGGMMAGGQAVGALGQMVGGGATVAAATTAQTALLAEGAIATEAGVAGGAVGGGGALASIGGMLLNPWVLGTLAVLGLGYGAYKLVERARKPIVPKYAGASPSNAIHQGQDYGTYSGEEISNLPKLPDGSTPMYINPQDTAYTKDGQTYMAKPKGPLDTIGDKASEAAVSAAKAGANTETIASSLESSNNSIANALRAQLEGEQLRHEALMKKLGDSQVVINNPKPEIKVMWDKEGIIASLAPGMTEQVLRHTQKAGA